MTCFSDDQIVILKELATRISDVDFVLIGSVALQAQLGGSYRQTEDMDLALSIAVNDLDSIFARFPNWRVDSRIEHRIHSPEGFKLDCLPAGPTVLQQGEILWPKTGFKMSMEGFRLVFDHYRTLEVTPGLDVKVALVSVIAFLKMISFMDCPNERERDLEDLMYMLDAYLGPFDERRWEDPVLENNPDYDTAPAFCLGCDLGEVLNDSEKSTLQAFMRFISDETDPRGIGAIASRLASKMWRVNSASELERRLVSLNHGFEITQHSG